MKIIRATTVPSSLDIFCRGLLAELSGRYEVVALSSPGPELDCLGKREGVRTVAVDMARKISPVADLRALFRLVRLLRRERPQMIHSMTPKAGLLCMTAAWIARVPVRVHTFTGLLFPTARGLKRHLLAATDRITCACATHVIPEGEGVRNDLMAARITRKPMRVLGYGNIRGVDLQRYRLTDSLRAEAAGLRSSLGIGTDDLVFVFIGRLVADKGMAELAGAFSSLGDIRAHLILVGDEEPQRDPLDSATLDTITRHPRIHRVGWQDDVRPWLAAADALVLPSYREGFPNAVLEAGAMGLPSIVTDINGSREVITDGHNGFIVPPRDTAALAQAMKRMTGDARTRRTMGEAARSIVAERYEQGYVRRCLMDFYRQILPEINE